MEFHVRSAAGAVNGPIDAETIGRLAAANKISAVDLACAEGSNDWQPLGRLFPATFRAPPAKKRTPWWAWLFVIIVAALWLWGREIGRQKQSEAASLAKEGSKVVSDIDAFNSDPQRSKWEKERIESRKKRFDDKSKEFFDKYGKPR